MRQSRNMIITILAIVGLTILLSVSIALARSGGDAEHDDDRDARQNEAEKIHHHGV